jgi:hypothetical protein
MQTRCSILPSIADKTKHGVEKALMYKQHVFKELCHVADWCNRLSEVWPWPPLSSSFTEAVTTIIVRDLSDTPRIPLALESQFGPWPTSMKLSVSLQFTRSETFGRTPWAEDQLVARPLPIHKYRKTHIHTQEPNTHALSWIRTHDPSFRASEDSACLRPLGYRDRHTSY